MRTLIVFIMLLIVGISNGQVVDTLIVYSNTGVWLRENPSIKSTKSLLIPYRTKIYNIIKIVDTTSAIDWTTDNWIKINFENNIGYVFKGFLSSFKFPNECDQLDYIDLNKYLKAHYDSHGQIDSTWTRNKYGEGKHLTLVQSYSDSILLENHHYLDGWCYRLISKNHNFNDGMNLFKAFSAVCYKEFDKVFDKAKYFKDGKGKVNRFSGTANWETISVWIEENEAEGLSIEICESVE